ncbi:hypothetical protein F2Q70_00028183 [Brassica cretica]|uniref:Uncharacterized protein n=2 Tax=Brassica cretica TaxID=69181 RepID=A0A8S9LB54_BRACR|nr:hypothetical protein F2Q68_00027743 [Brassica cretica]KAF2605390.1 hypothetical protein F2Q70_00028183 [Brassica cretica]KAF3581482.1 hypothetical protein DY000_02034887 [Brassica cretica]
MADDGDQLFVELVTVWGRSERELDDTFGRSESKASRRLDSRREEKSLEAMEGGEEAGDLMWRC